MYLENPYTERLFMRPLELSDSETWKEFFQNNNALKFIGMDTDLDPEEKAESWIRKQQERYRDKLFGHLALIDRRTNTFIGQCGLLVQEIAGKREVEIGYHVLPRFQGYGYATEAAITFRNFAFDNFLCSSLVSIIHVDNLASRRVAEKNRMEPTTQTMYHGMPVIIYRISDK